MNISSCIFENNNAMNGGAIYMDENIIKNNISIDNNDIIRNIEIKDTVFIKNNVQYYGGAIFINSKIYDESNIRNISFIDNSAYAGGALYMNGDNISILYQNNDDDNIRYINNTSESHGNNVATGPYFINHLHLDDITIKSGETIPLNFILTDKFNQTVNDISKYYSNIILNINIDEDEGNYLDIDQNNFKIMGNICNFSKGCL